jgi:uncharacterized protein
MNAKNRRFLMETDVSYMVFAGSQVLVSGDLRSILVQTKEYMDSEAEVPVLIFEEQTGKQVDFNFQGTLAEILARELPVKPVGPGRPKLGVISREVSLLPRHWEWLEQQPNGISAALRRLIEEARKRAPGKERARLMREAVSRVMTALAGNLPDYEESLRALYAKDHARLFVLISKWPTGVRAYVERVVNEAMKAEAEPTQS